jgi:hypothetical protein
MRYGANLYYGAGGGGDLVNLFCVGTSWKVEKWATLWEVGEINSGWKLTSICSTLISRNLINLYKKYIRDVGGGGLTNEKNQAPWSCSPYCLNVLLKWPMRVDNFCANETPNPFSGYSKFYLHKIELFSLINFNACHCFFLYVLPLN